MPKQSINQDVQNVMNALHITGKSPHLLRALNAAIQAAPYDVTVLVTGENGTGKDYFYRILHNGSRRRFKKCIAVNCGGLPEGTIDSELFGHVKGAYTGAVGERKGYFEEADGGTIFLDEVGDLPMSIQAKLLRVLETGEIIRMGSSEVRKVDVRIVAATNVNLEKAIREGRFRQDLYFRLSTINIHVPALRERQDDIPLLVRRFASDVANKYRMTEGISFTPDAQKLLLAYQWPGNIRQLLHVIEEISIVETDRVIDTDTLQRYLPQFASGISVEDSSTFAPGEKKWLYQTIFNMASELHDIRIRLGLEKQAPQHAPAQHLLTSHADQASHTDFDPLEIFGAPLNAQPANSDVPSSNRIDDVDYTEEVKPDSEEKADGEPRPMTMAEIQREATREALRRNGGNKRKAAEELDISERTIHRWISGEKDSDKDKK